MWRRFVVVSVFTRPSHARTQSGVRDIAPRFGPTLFFFFFFFFFFFLLQSQASAIARPSIQRQHLAPALLLLPEIFHQPAADLGERRAHDFTEVALERRKGEVSR